MTRRAHTSWAGRAGSSAGSCCRRRRIWRSPAAWPEFPSDVKHNIRTVMSNTHVTADDSDVCLSPGQWWRPPWCSGVTAANPPPADAGTTRSRADTERTAEKIRSDHTIQQSLDDRRLKFYFTYVNNCAGAFWCHFCPMPINLRPRSALISCMTSLQSVWRRTLIPVSLTIASNEKTDWDVSFCHAVERATWSECQVCFVFYR